MRRGEPAFVADRMLGTLAKWLRLSGFDTLYPAEMSDAEMLELALSEGRLLLTRDRELAGRARDGGLYLGMTDVREQVAFMKKELRLRKGEILSRCSLCNLELERVEGAAVRGLVPESVLFRKETIFLCRRCQKAYWMGSHWERMVQTLTGIWGDDLDQMS